MVSETLLLLQLEHGNVENLLGLLDEQVTALGEGRLPDAELLRAAVAYFSDFPEQCHHPKENMVYAKLREKAPWIADKVAPLVQEHTEMIVLTRQLADVVEAFDASPQEQAGALQGTLRSFIDYNRKHMAMEEEHFFPAALKNLSEDDWAEIDFALFDHTDPLFTDAREKRFRKLRERITELAAPRHRRMTAREYIQDHAAVLAGLRTVEEFNLWVNRIRDQIYLVRYSSGEYGLEDELDVIMAIPACSEERAVWCAYYFMVGYSTPT